ncbi:MAG: hypothetical protein K8S94_11375 [Planctomycetia bacterium]|nr:hypothetical protein [Planctomycetia bacterium]
MTFFNKTTLLLALTVLVGCGGGKGRFEYVPVRGKVTLDDNPAQLKNVFFYPEEGTQGLGAKALTHEDGSFELEAVVGGATEVTKGAVPGIYRITVTDFTIERGAPEELQQPQTRKPALKVPSIYSSSDTTPLRLEVTRDMQDVVLELKSKGR